MNTTKTTFGAALGMADQLGRVLDVMVEFSADRDAAERDPARVLRDMLLTYKPPPRTPTTVSRPARHFAVGITPTLDQLVPGVTVRRYTTHDRDTASTEIPCCDRPIQLPLDPGMAPHLYGCRFCGKAYTAVLVDEEAGEESYAAVFTVRPETFVVAGNHKPRKAAR